MTTTADPRGAMAASGVMPAHGVTAARGDAVLAAPSDEAAPAPGQVATDEAAGGRVRALDDLKALDATIDAIVHVESVLRMFTAFRAVLLDTTRRQVSGAEAELLRPASDTARGPAPAAPVRSELAQRAFVADLATALQLSERAARGLLEDARSLVHELPATLDALGHGTISYRHAQMMVEHTVDLDDAARRAVEAATLPRASSTTPSGFARHLRRTRERVHPEPLRVRHHRAAADRRVCLDPAADGMTWLSAFLPAVTGHAIMDRLDHAAAAVAGAEEPRTRDQLRADVLTALLLDDPHAGAARALGAVTGTDTAPGGQDEQGRNRTQDTQDARTRQDGHDEQDGHDTEAVVTERAHDHADDRADDRARLTTLARSLAPRVALTVPALTLLGHDDAPADLEGYGPIDPDTARELASAAPSLTRILTHPHTGAVLSVGRDSYAVPADLRRHLRVRDDTCRFPGCGRRAATCDVDHVVAFTDGGTTDADNLIHLCRHHHRLKHETSWRATLTTAPGSPPGTVTWMSPTGRAHTTEPATCPPTDRTHRSGPGPRPPGTDAPGTDAPESLDPPPF